MTDDAFAERLISHRPTVTGLVYKRLAGRPEADHEDMVAETLARAWAHRDQLTDRPDHEIRGFLCRTAVNLTIDWLRRPVSRDVPLVVEQITAQAFPIGGDRHVDVLALREALARLTERDRALLLEAYHDEVPRPVIAARRGLAYQAAKSLLHRSRERARAEAGRTS